MFAEFFRTARSKEHERDPQLSALLQQWQGVEPQTNFEAVVWRRIRSASAPEQRRMPVVTALHDWFMPRPAWANALAVAAGIVVGVGLAFAAPDAHGRHADEPLLHSQTLAGSYLTMLAGGPR